MTPNDSPKDAVPVPPASPGSPAARGWMFKLAALGLVVVSGLAGTGLARWLQNTSPETPREPNGPFTREGLKLPPALFRNWPRPDLALVLSAQQHGYILPCGCSHPQVGGLERRYNLVQLLREHGWPVVAADLGDIPQVSGPVQLPNHQGLIKYRYSMKALKAIGYSAVGIGEFEAAQDLFQVLGEWALNEPTPRVLAGNLVGMDEMFPDHKDWELVEVKESNLKVGIAAVVGPTVVEKVRAKDGKIRFAPTPATLDAILGKMAAQKVDLRVLLYQGMVTRSQKGEPPTEAIACAKAYPQFQVILCLSEQEEPSSDPVREGGTLILSVGQKGKYVGVVAVNRSTKPGLPWEFRYQLAELGEEYLTPKTLEDGHPVVKLMEDYTRELKEQNYLAKYGQVRHMAQVAHLPEMPTYVGSEACKKCHNHAYEVWKNSKHSHAYQTLVDAKRPSLRQYDAECIVCHTVGFGYLTGFATAETTPKLKDVGCESCHGPGSEHARHPNEDKWRVLANPWRAPENETPADKAKRLGRIDQFCQRCHDTDNDVTWTHGGFERKWPLIAHPTLPE